MSSNRMAVAVLALTLISACGGSDDDPCPFGGEYRETQYERACVDADGMCMGRFVGLWPDTGEIETLAWCNHGQFCDMAIAFNEDGTYRSSEWRGPCPYDVPRD